MKQSFEISEAQDSHFRRFSNMQSEILPDVQKIDLNGFRLLLERNEIILCVTVDKGEIAGFAILKDHVDHGLLRQLAVSPQFRKQGVGSILVEGAKNWFLARKLNEVKIQVKEHNIAAIKLYEKHGYSVVGKIYQLIIDWNKFDYKTTSGLTLGILPREEDLKVSKEFKISTHELKSFRDLSSSLSIGLFDTNNLIGFMRLRPKFPVLTPILLKDPKSLLDVIFLVRGFTDPKFDHLRISVEGEEMFELLRTQKWAALNFVLLKFSTRFQ